MIRIDRIAFLTLALAGALAAGCGGEETAPQGPPGEPGAPGDPGDPGEPGEPGVNDPAINAITPGIVYLNRTVSVTIGGNDTTWSDATTVDFGPGIQANIIAANPAVLLVNLTIDETAPTGPRDVTVDNGAEGGAVTLKGVFQVEPPLVIGTKGTPAQGSIFVARAEQKDLSTPFDTASDGEHVNMTSAPGVVPEIEEVQSYTIDFNMLVDVGVAPGDFDVRVDSGVVGATVASAAPNAIAIAARAPVPLVAGMQSPGSVAAPYESYLYSFAPGQHKLVTIEASAADPAAEPHFALLPESGKFADLVSFGPAGRVVTETDQPIYIIYWDSSGASGYPFDIDLSTADSGDLEPNDTCAMAQPLSGNEVSLANLSLRNAADEDWFVLDAVAADVGKLVHVTTKPGDDDTDTFVEVFTGSCANLVPLGPPSEDKNYHEDHASEPLAAAGKVYVKVSNSPTDSFRGSLYDLDVEFVRTETEPNNECAEANAVNALPANLGFVSLSSEADEDWFAVTVTAADIGMFLEVTTSPGDGNTDTYIEVSSGTCASLSLLGASADDDFHDSVKVGPLASAGTYFVRITNSLKYPYAGSRYNVNFSLAAPPDAEPNNTCAQAGEGGPLGVPLEPLSLPDQSDVDWFVFPTSAADVGKVVHVVTSPGDSDTDTVVEVFDGTCAALNPLGGPSDDIYYHEDWMSAPISQAEMVFVKVSYSTLAYVGAAYTLTVTYE